MRKKARSAIDTLLTADMTRKAKNFELHGSSHASDLWIDNLRGSSFPMLEALSITYRVSNPRYDFGTLKTLTGLSIFGSCLWQPIIVPASVQHLNVKYVAQGVLVSLLYQCPNLVEGVFNVDPQFFREWDDVTEFTKPLTLSRLNRLTCCVLNVAEVGSAPSLTLPSLEILQLRQHRQSKFIKFIPLCRIVSASLTTLIIKTSSPTLNYEDLNELCRLPYPKLSKLEFWSDCLESIKSAIHVLSLLEGENGNAKTSHLPALRSVDLHHKNDIHTRYLLDCLKEWRIGEVFYVHMWLNYDETHRYRWYDLPPGMEREFRSIMDRRRIRITTCNKGWEL